MSLQVYKSKSLGRFESFSLQVFESLTSYDNKDQEVIVDKISHLSDQDQCELIADEFAKIPNEYSPLHKEDISIPTFTLNEIPQFWAAHVWKNPQ